MDVHLISTTDGWAQFAVAGPNAGNYCKRSSISVTIFRTKPSRSWPAERSRYVGGAPARLFRISFSGELAYEIAVPARFGDAMIRALMAAGEEFDAVPYGTEALGRHAG